MDIPWLVMRLSFKIIPWVLLKVQFVLECESLHKHQTNRPGMTGFRHNHKQ